MHFLSDLHEWSLLRELSEWLSPRLALYMRGTVPINEHRDIHSHAATLEFELRHTFFTVHNAPQRLSSEKFGGFQEVIKQICSLLDHLAAHQRTRDDSKGGEYLHLEKLIGLLNPKCDLIDLVNGPGQRLFDLPSDAAELHECLIALTKCNEALNEVLAPPPLESVIQPSRRQLKKTPWKKGTIRDQAMCLFEHLFKHFKCGIPHEVLLKLIGTPKEDLTVSSLQLMLPSCLELKPWQEAQYNNADL